MNEMEQQINQMNQMQQQPQQMQQPMQGQPIQQQPQQMVAPTGGKKKSKKGKRKGRFFSNFYDKMVQIATSKYGKYITPIVLIGVVVFFWVVYGGNFMALFDGKFGN